MAKIALSIDIFMRQFAAAFGFPRRMTGMLRRFITCLSVLSLLLCLETVALWMRSYTHSTRASFGIEMVGGGFSSAGGLIVIHLDMPPDLWPNEFSDSTEPRDLIESRAQLLRRAGKAGAGNFFIWRAGPGERVFCGLLPHWCLSFGFGLIPAFWIADYCKGNRLKLSGMFCSSCGYDLRATPGRCPECGEVASIAKVKA